MLEDPQCRAQLVGHSAEALFDAPRASYDDKHAVHGKAACPSHVGIQRACLEQSRAIWRLTQHCHDCDWLPAALGPLRAPCRLAQTIAFSQAQACFATWVERSWEPISHETCLLDADKISGTDPSQWPTVHACHVGNSCSCEDQAYRIQTGKLSAVSIIYQFNPCPMLLLMCTLLVTKMPTHDLLRMHVMRLSCVNVPEPHTQASPACTA